MKNKTGWRMAGDLLLLGVIVYIFRGPPGSAGANIPYLVLHLSSWWLDLSTLAS